MKSITIKAYTKIGWDVHIIDTDFHATVNTIFNASNIYEKAIIIGKYNWLGFGSTIMKGTITPDFCIVSAKALISRDFSNEGENIVLAGVGDITRVVARHIKGDFSDWTED